MQRLQEARRTVNVTADYIRYKALFHSGLTNLQVEVASAVAGIEQNAALAGFKQTGQNLSVLAKADILTLALIDVAYDITGAEHRRQLIQGNGAIGHVNDNPRACLFGNLHGSLDRFHRQITVDDAMGNTGFEPHQIIGILPEELYDLLLVKQCRIQILGILVVGLAAGGHQQAVQEANLSVGNQRVPNMLVQASTCSAAIHGCGDTATGRHRICVDTAFAGASHIVYMVVDQSGCNNTAICINHLTILVIRFRCGNFAINQGNIPFPGFVLSRIIDITVFDQEIH